MEKSRAALLLSCGGFSIERGGCPSLSMHVMCVRVQNIEEEYILKQLNYMYTQELQ